MRTAARALAGPICAAVFATAHAARAAAPPEPVPMAPELWTRPAQPLWVPGRQDAQAVFARYEGMPSGVMTIPDEAVWAARRATFSTGTIEFDIKPLGYNDAGLIFHRQADDGGAFFYLRANPECPAADDCIQYVPINHGLMPWNIYSAEQKPASINPAGWNHVRLVVAGGGMEVFLNHLSEPALVVPTLGAAPDGGLAFKGPAAYANLVLRPGDTAGFTPPPETPPPPGTIVDWSAAPPAPLRDGRAPRAADIPARAWTPVAAARDGLLDLGRRFGSAHARGISTAWLRFTVHADAPARRTLDLGFADQVTVFLDGRPIYSGDNFYFPTDHRLSPDGRLEPDNAVIPLDLRPGDHQLVLAVGNRWHTSAGGEEPSPYGWGVEARLRAAP